MSVSAQTLRLHLGYTAWASTRLLEAAAALTPEELARDFKTADKTLLDTLAHIFRASGEPRSSIRKTGSYPCFKRSGRSCSKAGKATPPGSATNKPGSKF